MIELIVGDTVVLKAPEKQRLLCADQIKLFGTRVTIGDSGTIDGICSTEIYYSIEEDGGKFLWFEDEFDLDTVERHDVIEITEETQTPISYIPDRKKIIEKLLEDTKNEHCEVCFGTGSTMEDCGQSTLYRTCSNCRGTGQSYTSLSKKIDLILEALNELFR